MRRMISTEKLNFVELPKYEITIHNPENRPGTVQRIDELYSKVMNHEIKNIGIIFEFSDEMYGSGYLRQNSTGFKIMTNMVIPNEDETGLVTIANIWCNKNEDGSWSFDIYDVNDDDVTDYVFDSTDPILVF